MDFLKKYNLKINKHEYILNKIELEIRLNHKLVNKNQINFWHHIQSDKCFFKYNLHDGLHKDMFTDN